MIMEPTATTEPVVDVAGVVVEVLTREGQALTPAQVRSQLRRHHLEAEEVRRCLERLASEGKVHAWPAYRSKTPRYALQTQEAAARDMLVRLLAEDAYTRPELIATVRREIGGLEQPVAERLLDQLLAEGKVRKLPPRLGGTANLLGTPTARSYLQPLFANLGRSLARLLPRLESEGVSRAVVLEEAQGLWENALREAQSEEAAEAEAGTQATSGAPVSPSAELHSGPTSQHQHSPTGQHSDQGHGREEHYPPVG
jgi:hypothetical protein